MQAPTNPTTPLRIAMLGCAHTGHASSYLNALTKISAANLCAIYDSDTQRAQFYGDQFHVKAYQSLPDILSTENLDAAIICSQTNQHKEIALAAAHSGLSILCEKPIANNLTDARDIIYACQTAGVLLQTAFVSRFYLMLQTARRLVQSGEWGAVLGIVGGNRGIPPLPPAYPDWITDPHLAGGGALLDHSVHVTDAMRFVLGQEVQTVFARSGKFFQPELAVEDSALISLVFQDGVIASVNPSWSTPLNNPYHYDFYLRILCEKGVIDLDDTRQALSLVSDNPHERPISSETFGMDVDLEMVHHFIACVQAGQNLFPAASGEDGVRALEIALAGYQSVHEQQPVNLFTFEEKKL